MLAAWAGLAAGQALGHNPPPLRGDDDSKGRVARLHATRAAGPSFVAAAAAAHLEVAGDLSGRYDLSKQDEVAGACALVGQQFFRRLH
jgi:hypothetical protein